MLGRNIALGLIVVAGVAGTVVGASDIPRLIGWDLEVVCSSLRALSAGHDPYLAAKPTPLPYPVLHVYLWAPLCAFGNAPIIPYVILFSLIALVSAVLLCQIVPNSLFDRTIVFVAILLSFDFFQWQIRTGNIAVMELPLAVGVVLLLDKRKYFYASALFGLMASLKILPLFGVFALLFIPDNMRLRLTSVGVACASFIAVHLVNALLFFQWFSSYATQLVNRLPGSALYETGGGASLTQDTFDLVIQILARTGIHQPLPEFVIACLGLGAAWLTNLACSRSPLPPVAIVSLVLLVLWLFLFRLKPYSFETFIPFMIAVACSIGTICMIGVVGLSIIIPSLFRAQVINLPIIGSYFQLVAAWASILMLLLCAIIQSRRPSHCFLIGDRFESTRVVSAQKSRRISAKTATGDS